MPAPHTTQLVDADNAGRWRVRCRGRGGGGVGVGDRMMEVCGGGGSYGVIEKVQPLLTTNELQIAALRITVDL